MNAKQRIEALEKDAEILRKNLDRLTQQLQQLDMQRNQTIQELIKVEAKITERKLDLVEEESKKES